MSVHGRKPSPDDGHQRYDELAVGWALHALEPEDEAVFAAHRPGCARCEQTIGETTEVMASLAADLPPAEPSAALRARLHAAVAEAEQSRPAPRGSSRKPGSATATDVPHLSSPPAVGPVPARSWAPRRRLLTALAAAAVAAVLGIGGWSLVLADSRAELQTALAEREQIVDTLLTPGEARVEALSSSDEGRAVATVVARPDRVDVVSHGLPVNDADSETYVVWGIDGDEPEALGTFDVQRSEMTLQTVGSGSTGLDDYSRYGISLEPGRQAPSTPTEIVAMG